MIDTDECSMIVQKYYREMFAYCYTKLGRSYHAAEDCTQELFMLLITKRKKLENSGKLRLWLYRSADNIIRSSLRRRSRPELSLDDVPEVMEIPDRQEEYADSPLDMLSQEERSFLEAYYGCGYGERSEAAKRLGISLPAMYRRVHRIKEKLRGENGKR